MGSDFILQSVLDEPPQEQLNSSSESEKSEGEEDEKLLANVEGPGFSYESSDICIANLEEPFDPNDEFWDL